MTIQSLQSPYLYFAMSTNVWFNVCLCDLEFKLIWNNDDNFVSVCLLSNPFSLLQLLRDPARLLGG